MTEPSKNNSSLYESYLAYCNAHDFAAMETFYTSDITVNDLPMTPAAVTAQFAPLVIGFPDWHWEARHVVVDSQNIVVHFTVTGTHRGVFRDVEPTGRRISVSEFTLYRVINGKFAAVWDLVDAEALMQQIT